MGRPDHVQLIFNRRVNRRTPSRYRTRVITDGVIPSLHVDYKHSRIKQYHREGRALRTETVINDTYDFAVGRRLRNLDDLKKIGASVFTCISVEATERRQPNTWGREIPADLSALEQLLRDTGVPPVVGRAGRQRSAWAAGRASAISSGTRPPPTVRAMYCRPPDR